MEKRRSGVRWSSSSLQIIAKRINEEREKNRGKGQMT